MYNQKSNKKEYFFESFPSIISVFAHIVFLYFFSIIYITCLILILLFF